MQRLIAFIEHNFHIILLVVLQAVSFFLIFSLNPFQQAVFTNTASFVTSEINNATSQITRYFGLKEQNIILQNQFVDRFNGGFPQKLNYLNDTFEVKDSSKHHLYDAIPAQVIYNTSFKMNNVFVINKGAKHGVHKNMGVVSSQGVAGVVLDANDTYSTVMSLLNTKLKIVPFINGQEYFTELIWKNDKVNHLSIKGINKLEQINEGDLVSTGKSSLLFPQGIPIGNISELIRKPSSQYFELELRTSTNFRNLDYVFVIVNKDFERLNTLLSNHE